MLAKVAIRDIMKRKDVGTNRLAKLIGKRPQVVWERLSPDKSTNLSTDKLNELVSALGYKIVLMPVEAEVQEDWYVIEDSRNAGRVGEEAE